MFSAALSFLTGSTFRFLFSHVADYFEKKQDHSQQMDRMRLEAETDKGRHERDLERSRLLSDLGIKEIEVQAVAEVEKTEARTFTEVTTAAAVPIGIAWVDAWNGIIRPLAATICILLWVLALNSQGWKMTEWDTELVGTILGFFFASRALAKRRESKSQ